MNQTSRRLPVKAMVLLLTFYLVSCNNADKAPPFPYQENEYSQPETKDFTFSEPDTLTWIVQDPSKIKPLPTTKFDWDKLPSKPFDIGVPFPLKKPLEEEPFNWNDLPSIPFSLDSLPQKTLKIKVTVLGAPKIVKAGLFETTEGATRGVMTLGANFGFPSTAYGQMMDKDGMIWIGTNNGIVKYDSENLEIYGLDQGLNIKSVNGLWEDSKGRIWVSDGSDNHLSVIDKKSNLIYDLSSAFKSNGYYDITEAADGQFWVGNSRIGLDIIDFENRIVRQFKPENGLLSEFFGKGIVDKKGLMWIPSMKGFTIIDQAAEKIIHLTNANFPGTEANIRSMHEDKEGKVWIAGRNNVYILNENKTGLATFSTLNGLDIDNRVFSEIYQDSSGKIWMGTNWGTIYSFSEKQGLLEKFKLNNLDTPQWIYNFLEDKQGDIWAAVGQGGIYKIDTNSGRPGNFQTVSGLANDNVWATLEASDHKMWIGTHGGIDIYDPETRTLKHLGTAQGLNHERNTSLLEDSKGRIWAAGISGVSIIDPKNGTIKKLSSKEGLPDNRITSIIEGQNGAVWMGSAGGGILNIDIDRSVYKTLTVRDSTENASRINRLLKDTKGQLWEANNEFGVYQINTNNNTRRKLNSSNGLISDVVFSIGKDKEDNIWATTENGVQYINVENQKLTTFTVVEGLASNDVYDAISHKNEIFLGTAKGLTIIEPVRGDKNSTVYWKAKTLGAQQGLSYVDFAQNSLGFDKEGRLWAGVERQIMTIIDPIIPDTLAYPTYITTLNIFDKPQVFKDKALIREKIANLDTVWARGKNAFYGVNKAAKDSSYLSLNDIQWESVQGPYGLPVGLILPYTQNYLSFNFNGAQFSNPDKVVYRYILEGIDKNWSPVTDKTTSENYRDLAPGKYTFKVASKGFNGVWSAPAEFEFTILPPWWQTWWAYTIFVILFLGLGLVILHYRSKWLKKENRILEERVTQRTAELKKTIHELENTQSQLIQSEKMASLGELTAGIAHEIQNPMNFINNFAEVSNELMGEMCEELDKGDIEEAKVISKDIVQNLEKISHHGKRASSIVRGMLEHSRNSSGQREMIDINVLADEYLRLAYHGLRAKDKSFNADFKTDFDASLPKVSIIPQDLGRVVLNLINNAFYAVTSIPEDQRGENYKPCVTVSTRNLKDQVLISIKDNGPGIPAEIKDKIFQPFFTTKPTGKGTGLGLSLAYDIVTTGHGGAIELKTEEGEGTEFSIYIPMSQK